MTRFHRTTRLLKGDAWDLAPFLCVLFPLAVVLLFQNSLVRPAGSVLRLPSAGTNAPVLAPGRRFLVVAVDAGGRIYFDNRQLEASQLGPELAVRMARLPPAEAQDAVLVLEADLGITHAVVEKLGRIARTAGLREIILTGQP